MLDDVCDLGGLQPEVDRHENAPARRYAVQQLQQPRRVVRNHGDPVTGINAELVEPGSERATPPGELGICQCAELVYCARLVDDRRPVAINSCGASEKVTSGLRHLHVVARYAVTTALTRAGRAMPIGSPMVTVAAESYGVG